jgi:uncharacterized phiE125 gp8 family phage protein
VYGLSLITGPVEEPLTVAELKTWLRVEHTTDDTLIESLGKTARAMAERWLGRQLITATWMLTLDGFPWPGGWQFMEAPQIHPDPHTIRLPKAPLQSVTSIQYYDMADTLQTLASTVYVVDATTDPGRIVLAMAKVWPVTRLKPGAVRITFVAGYAAASSVPEELKLAIRIAVAFWYENRGESLDRGELSLPMASQSLLWANWNGETGYGI